MASERVTEMGKRALPVFGFQNLGRKLRNRKRLRKGAEKNVVQGLEQMLCSEKTSIAEPGLFTAKGGGEVSCLQAGITSAEGERCGERAREPPGEIQNSHRRLRV